MITKPASINIKTFPQEIEVNVTSLSPGVVFQGEVEVKYGGALTSTTCIIGEFMVVGGFYPFVEKTELVFLQYEGPYAIPSEQVVRVRVERVFDTLQMDLK